MSVDMPLLQNRGIEPADVRKSDVSGTSADSASHAKPLSDPGLIGLCRIAHFYRVAADPAQLHHTLALGSRLSRIEDLARAAAVVGLKSRVVARMNPDRLAKVATPVLLELQFGFAVLATKAGEKFRLLGPGIQDQRELSLDDLVREWTGTALLLSRKLGAGGGGRAFGFAWFLPSIKRYSRPLSHVLIASFFVQIFGLITPLFFQIVVDKVLAHKGISTLIVVTIGMVGLGLFNVILQYLRSYALSHTTTRIDVELGARLFHHLLRLPLGYFETRAAGQTVARMRELETIRNFLTGQALFSVIDLIFAFVFVGVLFAYSWFLALVVLVSAPVYALIATIIRPFLRELIREKFNRGAASQQFLVEAVVGVQTLKASAIEPMMQTVWEEKLAAYVKTSLDATMLGSLGQNSIQYVSTLTTAAVMYFGAEAVIANQMSIGELIAFNMIAGQLTQPILRLSQLFQDFQQVQVSVERLADILDAPVEPQSASALSLPPPQGAIEFKNIRFRYRPGLPEVLSNVSLAIKPGEVIGIVGQSGSGKSTLTKLVQRFYTSEEGHVLLDGLDIAQLDPAWLRRQIGVVLQENLLFNRTIHDNIAIADPAMSRARVMHMAKLSGAHEFIAQLPQGYDTMIEERGSNLSGGQRQRIAIARALATNPSILIFDEATSALDYESERIIQDNMREIVKGRTVLIIAHRLAAVRDCHRIVGMNKGRIVEVGTHDQLLTNPNSLYAHLWNLQSGSAPRSTTPPVRREPAEAAL